VRAQGVAVVTGASRGLGRAIALELAVRGFDVVATMRDPDAGVGLPDEAAARNGRLRVEALDVEHAEAYEVPEGLRVLVNNAGLDGAYLPLEATPLEQWRALFETNLFGVVETTRRAVPSLRRSGGGVVCNITSASLLFPMPFYSIYRASKAAVSALGESLHAELAGFGIRVLEILPGPIETDMLAASDRPLEARELAAYRELAERAHAGRRAVEGQTTSAAAAAAAIADAILDDDGPLRRACDPLGAALLEGWRASSDEDWHVRMLAGFGVGEPPPEPEAEG